MAVTRGQLFVILAATLSIAATVSAQGLCPDAAQAGMCNCTGADQSKQSCQCQSSPSSLCKKNLPMACGPNANGTTPAFALKRFVREPISEQPLLGGTTAEPTSAAPGPEPTGATGAGTTLSPGGGSTVSEECSCDDKDYYCLSCRESNMCRHFFEDGKSAGVSIQSSPLGHLGPFALVMLIAAFICRHR